MKLAIANGFAALLLLGATPAEKSATLLDRLAGHWVLDGTLGGKHTTHDVEADRVLNGGYLRIHEVSREKNADGTPAYEAIVFISVDAKSGEYACLWLDNTSNAGLTNGVTARAKPAASSIPFEFRDKEGKVFFRNTFVYDPEKNTWQWLLDDWSTGKAEPFARVTLTRR